MYLTKLKIQRQFLTFIIVDTMVIIFYKATYNIGLTFHLVITKWFDFFYTKILAFIFAIIHCNISEYQSRNKFVKTFW